MGAQDSFGFAQEFRETTGTVSFPMYWDEGFTSWSHFGVSSQPTVVLVNAAGEEIGSWRGAIPEGEVLQLAAEA